MRKFGRLVRSVGEAPQTGPELERPLVVDDVLFLDETAKKIESRLSDSFAGCDGPHWVEEK
jgi:hypothetical protein